MSKIKLVHPNLRGRAEPIRLCFHAAGKDFEDCRLHSREDMEKEKENSPNRKFPYMEVDGQKITQSSAIAYFAAKHCGLCGKDLLEETRVMSIFAETVDMLEAMVRVHFAHLYETDDLNVIKEMKKKLNEETLPNALKILEGSLQENGYYVGSGLTLADLAVYDILESVLLTGPTLDGFSGLNALRAKVEDNDGIKAYLATRPKDMK